MQPDYYSVLLRVIAAATHDPAQTRRVIYELARINLKKELWLQYGEFGGAGVRRQMLQLETAIRGVEARCAQEEALGRLAATAAPGELPGPGGDRSSLLIRAQSAPLVPDEPADPAWIVQERGSDNALVIRPNPGRALAQPPAPQAYAEESLPTPQPAPAYYPPPPPKRFTSALWSMAQLVVAAVLGVAIYALAAGRFEAVKFQSPVKVESSTPNPVVPAVAPVAATEPAPKQQERLTETTTTAAVPKAALAVTEAAPPSRSMAAAQPLPTVYGIYVLNNGQLSELEPLPIRVPDQRVSISAPISTPSRTVLPDGKVSFILYRREFITNAPEKAAVRVVARIARALTFNSSGAPTVVKLNDLWAVRGNAYDFRVAPMLENQEMIAILPPRGDFALAPGRYALTIKGVAYDFTVDGKVTDIAQCLERTDAVNGAFYSECRNP